MGKIGCFACYGTTVIENIQDACILHRNKKCNLFTVGRIQIGRNPYYHSTGLIRYFCLMLNPIDS